MISSKPVIFSNLMSVAVKTKEKCLKKVKQMKNRERFNVASQ